MAARSRALVAKFSEIVAEMETLCVSGKLLLLPPSE